jgi:polysaccharide chain length determinant protein (PEP-CTERM system associated)
MMEHRDGNDPVPAILPNALAVLRRRWAVATFTALIIVVVATPYVLGLPRLYRSSATLLVERSSGEAPGEIDARLQSIKQEALGRDNLAKLLERFNLYPALRQQGQDAALARLQSNIKVENTGTEQVNGQPVTIAFKVSYVGRDPESSVAVTNALASFYVAQSAEMRSRMAAQTAGLLKTQLDETRVRLDDQQARLRGYTARNIGALPQQVGANLAALERFNSQLRLNNDAQLKLIERRQTLRNQVAELDTRPPTDPNGLEAQLARLKKDLGDAQARFTDKHPEVRELRDQIATLERELSSNQRVAERAAAGKTLQAALAETDAQIVRLDRENDPIRRSIAAYERRVESTPARAPESQSVAGDYQATRDQYDALQKRYDEALMAARSESGKSGAQFRILDAAQASASTEAPSLWILVVLSLLMAAAIGLIAATIVDWLDTSFHSVDDLRAFTRVPVLTSIPLIQASRSARRLRGGLMIGISGACLATLSAAAFLIAHDAENVARLLSRLG